MKAVILAGGLGSRISEDTEVRPKPMIEIGGKPILWHIMKIYSAHGINEFIICGGYKSYVIEEFFAKNSYCTTEFKSGKQGATTYQGKGEETWDIKLVDTGELTMTGGRLRRAAQYVLEDETFCLTYGDGVGDIDISGLLEFHHRHGKLATVTAVHPPARFGALKLGINDLVESFEEKPTGDGGWINGGFFVLDKRVIDRITGDTTVWELGPLSGLAQDGELMAFKHHGFWQPMDTLREKKLLQKLWEDGNPPWKVWV
ncbi:MAG: glucose-1-phosphate cytidylyltransferase [Rhodospirillaceae bacterium]